MISLGVDFEHLLLYVDFVSIYYNIFNNTAIIYIGILQYLHVIVHA